jgi:SAM-dependent methyltransferase
MSASLAARSVTPEWLDTLPAEDPRAIRSRRDLVVVNALMGNARALASALRAGKPRRIAELGGGSGRVLANVAESLRAREPVEAVIVDLNPCVDDVARQRFARVHWHVASVRSDVFAWLEAQPEGAYDAIVANLFLHHFDDAALRRMLGLIARKSRTFVACEPLRTRFAERAAYLLPLLGCNDVTRHDAVVSVRAGFRGREISALWPARGWTCEERRWGLFTQRFVAKVEA